MQWKIGLFINCCVKLIKLWHENYRDIGITKSILCCVECIVFDKGLLILIAFVLRCKQRSILNILTAWLLVVIYNFKHFYQMFVSLLFHLASQQRIAIEYQYRISRMHHPCHPFAVFCQNMTKLWLNVTFGDEAIFEAAKRMLIFLKINSFNPFHYSSRAKWVNITHCNSLYHQIQKI